MIDKATKIKILEEAKILSNLDDNIIFERIGSVKYYQSARKGVRAKANYEKIGRDEFNKIMQILRKKLCNKNGEPKKTFLSGDWYEVVFALLAELSNGIIVAVIAILMKRGLKWFCKRYA